MTSRVVIVGAGFAGTLSARLLRKKLSQDIDIVLLDPKDDFLFTPRLIDLLEDPAFSRAHVEKNLHELARRDGFIFLQGRATHIHRDTKTITYEPTSSSKKVLTLSYDALVLSQGAHPSFYHIPGAEAHTLPLKTEEDVRHIHGRVQDLLRQADRVATREDKQSLLRFLVVGGGATGIEALCALKVMVERACQKEFAPLLPLLSWGLIQAGPQILPGFPIPIVEKTIKELEQQGIALSMGEAVTEVYADGLKTTTQTLSASLIVWCAGIEPSSIPIEPPLHADPAGYLASDRFLRLAPNIFGAGDIIVYKESNVLIPKNAQTAMRMAPLIAENVCRCLQGLTLIPFHYVSRGNLLILGKTGFIDAGWFTVKTRFAPWIRNVFYRYRFWQMTR